MSESILPQDFIERIKAIHKLSQDYNCKLNNSHSSRLIELIKEHAEEIESLYNSDNSHYLTETGDLILLCFELLLENNSSINGILLQCLKRFETKLPRLLGDLE